MKWLSDCHNAPVRVVGGDEGTNHWECAECELSCNAHHAASEVPSGADEGTTQPSESYPNLTPDTNIREIDSAERARRHKENTDYSYKHGLDKLLRPEEVTELLTKARIEAELQLINELQLISAVSSSLQSKLNGIEEHIAIQKAELSKEPKPEKES